MLPVPDQNRERRVAFENKNLMSMVDIQRSFLFQQGSPSTEGGFAYRLGKLGVVLRADIQCPKKQDTKVVEQRMRENKGCEHCERCALCRHNPTEIRYVWAWVLDHSNM